jgi:cobalt/nickel transport system permease protein
LSILQQPNSTIRQLDARVKITLTLAFIISLSLTPVGSWPAFALFLSAILCLAILLRISISDILKRALLALPFAMAAVPLIFLGPAPQYHIPFANLDIWLSLRGIERFLSIVFKSWISLQAAIIFAAITPVPEMLAGFRNLGLPGIFVAVIGLMWRYLSILEDEAHRLLRARASRSSVCPIRTPRRPGGDLIWRGRVAGGMVGNLLLRGIERSERVYAAMLARGYNGEPPFNQNTPMNDFDKRILFYGLIVLLLLLILGIMTGGH